MLHHLFYTTAIVMGLVAPGGHPREQAPAHGALSRAAGALATFTNSVDTFTLTKLGQPIDPFMFKAVLPPTVGQTGNGAMAPVTASDGEPSAERARPDFDWPFGPLDSDGLAVRLDKAAPLPDSSPVFSSPTASPVAPPVIESPVEGSISAPPALDPINDVTCAVCGRVVDPPAAPVPEPGTWLMMLIGLAFMPTIRAALVRRPPFRHR